MNQHVMPPAIVPASANTAYQQARQFLAVVLPWPADDGQPAYVNIHWSMEKEGRDN